MLSKPLLTLVLLIWACYEWELLSCSFVPGNPLSSSPADAVPLTCTFLSDSNASSRQFVPGWHDRQLHRHLPARGHPRPLEGEHHCWKPLTSTSIRIKSFLNLFAAPSLSPSAALEENCEPGEAVKSFSSLAGKQKHVCVEIGSVLWQRQHWASQTWSEQYVGLGR